MRLCSIASGSSGNCIYVGDDSTHILVDAGISKKKIEAGLLKVGIKGEELDGILVTHEHVDHIQGLGVFSRKYEIPMLAASPASCSASDMIATLPVKMPPKNSNTENTRFKINATKILCSFFIFPPLFLNIHIRSSSDGTGYIFQKVRTNVYIRPPF